MPTVQNLQSVKSQILARVVDLVSVMKSDGTFRLLERRNALFLTEAIRPALHIVSGDETALVEDERGYTMKFPLVFQAIYDAQRDPYGAADNFEAALQRIIESDEQLAGLASKITYEGASPFVSEEQKPAALVVVMYQVEYRRLRSKPEKNY